MNRHSKRRDVIAEEAAAWLIALQYPEASTETEFVKWLKLSPEHVTEFLAVSALWDGLPDVSSEPSSEQLLALATGDRNLVTLADFSAAAKPVQTRIVGFRSWFGLAAACAALALAATAVMIPLSDDSNLYKTEVGEQTSLPLPDGSIMTLNTRSSVRLAYNDAYRDVELLEGEALFEVAKNSERPFRVLTEWAIAEAVGTQFNVRSNVDDITVTVVEGIVDVSTNPLRNSEQISAPATERKKTEPVQAVRLVVGQQARIQASSGEVAVLDMPIENAAAWQRRRLIFDFVPLKDVIAEFNRYSESPIVVDDPELARLPISGAFRSNDRSSFLQFLAQMQLAGAHTRRDGTIVLRSLEEDQ